MSTNLFLLEYEDHVQVCSTTKPVVKFNLGMYSAILDSCFNRSKSLCGIVMRSYTQTCLRIFRTDNGEWKGTYSLRSLYVKQVRISPDGKKYGYVTINGNLHVVGTTVCTYSNVRYFEWIDNSRVCYSCNKHDLVISNVDKADKVGNSSDVKIPTNGYVSYISVHPFIPKVAYMTRNSIYVADMVTRSSIKIFEDRSLRRVNNVFWNHNNTCLFIPTSSCIYKISIDDEEKGETKIKKQIILEVAPKISLKYVSLAPPNKLLVCKNSLNKKRYYDIVLIDENGNQDSDFHMSVPEYPNKIVSESPIDKKEQITSMFLSALETGYDS